LTKEWNNHVEAGTGCIRRGVMKIIRGLGKGGDSENGPRSKRVLRGKGLSFRRLFYFSGVNISRECNLKKELAGAEGAGFNRKENREMRQELRIKRRGSCGKEGSLGRERREIGSLNCRCKWKHLTIGVKVGGVLLLLKGEGEVKGECVSLQVADFQHLG